METELAHTYNGIDSLVPKLRRAYSFEHWDHLIHLADDMLNKVVYDPHQAKAKVQAPGMEKPLIYYLGYGNLMKGVAYQKKKQYKEAKLCIDNYNNLHLFSDGSEGNRKIVEDFKFFAKANSYTVEISSGNTDQLEDYVSFIQQNPSETLPGLVTILECANTNNFEVDRIIQPLLDAVIHLKHENMSTTERTYYLSILHQLSLYYYKKNILTDSINVTIETLSRCVV